MRNSAFELRSWTRMIFHVMLKMNFIGAASGTSLWVSTVVKPMGARAQLPGFKSCSASYQLLWLWTGSLMTLHICLRLFTSVYIYFHLFTSIYVCKKRGMMVGISNGCYWDLMGWESLAPLAMVSGSRCSVNISVIVICSITMARLIVKVM